MRFQKHKFLVLIMIVFMTALLSSAAYAAIIINKVTDEFSLSSSYPVSTVKA